jgi:1-acyl-sn-glycerol-3-phosphate acyltransferase
VRSTVVGRENLQGSGRKIVTSNHRSTFDPIPLFALIVQYRRDVTFLAMAELFRNPVMRAILEWFGIIPVKRGTQAAVQASEMGIAALRAGGVTVAFIEGKISTTGSLLPPKSGVAYMAIQTGAPVIPVAMVGTENVKRVDTAWWKWGWRARYVIVIGEAIHPPVLIDPTSRQRQVFTDKVMASIAQLQQRAEEILAAK